MEYPAKARPSGGFFAFEGPLLPRSDLARSKCFPNGFAARVHRKHSVKAAMVVSVCFTGSMEDLQGAA
jgi:hypothetical protein